MRLRIIRGLYYAKRDIRYNPGDIVHISEDEAQTWVKAGIAMVDKSQDGASEHKAAMTPEEPAVPTAKPAKQRPKAVKKAKTK